MKVPLENCAISDQYIFVTGLPFRLGLVSSPLGPLESEDITLVYYSSDQEVVIRVQEPRQTKESARRDGAAVARLLCGHMFLLCGAGPYVCIGWLWAWG